MAEKEAVIANLNSVPLLNLIRQQEEVGEEKKERRGFCRSEKRGEMSTGGKRKEFFFLPQKFVKENGTEQAVNRKTVKHTVWFPAL